MGMINKHTGIRIASTFTSARNVPLEIGQQPTEYTRKHGVTLASNGNAGMALAKSMRSRMVQAR